MTLTIRAIEREDAHACGQVAYDAHRAVATAHNFPLEQPSVEFATDLINIAF
jgi:hypothetical protein